MLRKWFHETDRVLSSLKYDPPPPPKSVKSTGKVLTQSGPAQKTQADRRHRPFILTEVVAVGSG